MKKILILAIATGLVISASATPVHPIRPYYGRPHVVVTTGIYSPYPYYGFYGYPWYAYPPVGYTARPTKLDIKVEDIRNDYKEKIWSARHDKTLDRKERKATVHELKADRDKAIADASRNYYKAP